MIPTVEQYEQMNHWLCTLQQIPYQKYKSSLAFRYHVEVCQVKEWLKKYEELNTTPLLDEEINVGNFEFIKEIKKQNQKKYNENSYIRRRGTNGKKPR